MDTISSFDEGAASGPKYQRLAGTIRSQVQSGAISAGEKLPPVRDLAWKLGITPGTVARAYALLTDEGVLEAAVGRGTFVAQPKDATDYPSLYRSDAPDSHFVSFYSPKLPDIGQSDAIRAAMRAAADDPELDLLNYPTQDAFKSARAAVVEWLQGAQIGPITEQDIVLTNGGQNGISLVMQAVLRGRRPVVLVEELSYPGFRRAAELMRAEVIPVPMDANGIIPEELDRLAKTHNAQLLCTSPEVHNPTGLMTPLDRRQQIAQVARARGFDILEDDCYRLADARFPSYRLLVPRQSWHVSSVSKILSPALRVGFTIAPVERTQELRRVAEFAFFGLSKPLAAVIEHMLTNENSAHLATRVRGRVTDYVRSCVNALGGFNLTWHEDVPFLWLELPEGWRATAFCQAAEGAGVQVRPAEDFALRDARVPHAVRLSVNGQVSLLSFDNALQRLRRLLDNPPASMGV